MTADEKVKDYLDRAAGISTDSFKYKFLDLTSVEEQANAIQIARMIMEQEKEDEKPS